jgi:REP element-mobilizing transposase RayT
MPRKRRIQYPGACYHVISRGNEKKDIYRDDQDRYKFLRIFAETVKDFDLIIHAYVLMPNHYHLVVETPKPNLSKAMHFLGTKYGVHFNYKYKRTGHLFQGRYKGILAQREGYLLELTRYVHLNPIRAGLVKKLKDYRWSSYRELTGGDEWRRIASFDWTLSQFDKNRYLALKKYRKHLAAGRGVSEKIIEDNTIAGLVLGSREFALSIFSEFGMNTEKTQLDETQPADVIASVADEFKTTKELILKGSMREHSARKTAMALIRKTTNLKLKEIAEMFSVHHTAINKAINQLETDMERNPELKAKITALTHKLGSDPIL